MKYLFITLFAILFLFSILAIVFESYPTEDNAPIYEPGGNLR